MAAVDVRALWAWAGGGSSQSLAGADGRRWRRRGRARGRGRSSGVPRYLRASPPSVPQGSPPSVLGTAAMAEEPSALPWSINKDDYELQEVIGEDFGPNFGGAEVKFWG